MRSRASGSWTEAAGTTSSPSRPGSASAGSRARPGRALHPRFDDPGGVGARRLGRSDGEQASTLVRIATVLDGAAVVAYVSRCGRCPPSRSSRVVERACETRTFASSCWAALEVLSAQFGEDIPYDGALDQGFNFRGQRVPFLNYQQGIYRAAAQRGPAALSILTSSKSPYDDKVDDGGPGLRISRRARSTTLRTEPFERPTSCKCPSSTTSRDAPGAVPAFYPCYVDR